MVKIELESEKLFSDCFSEGGKLKVLAENEMVRRWCKFKLKKGMR